MQVEEFLSQADYMPEGMLLVTSGGEIQAINRVAIRQLGKAQETLLGRNLAELTGLHADEVVMKLKPCARSRNPVRLAFRSSSSGAFIPLTSCEGFLATPANDTQAAQVIIRLGTSSTQSGTFIALNQEIEKQRRVLRRLEQNREQLRISEENLAITLNSIGDAVMVTDESGLLVSLNPVAEQLTGWSSEEARGQSVKTVFPIVDASTRMTIDNPVEKVLASGETVYLSNHTTLISRDGSEYQIADSAAPIREKDGSRILGMVLVFHDVTEQYRLRQEAVRSQEKLKASEQLYKNLVETTAATAWEFDIASGQFTYMSPKIVEITGYAHDEWKDFDSWAERIHPDDRERVTCYCRQETLHGRDHTIEYRCMRADGSSVWLRDEVSVISREDLPVTMRGYFFDISESRQTEEALRRSQKMDAIGQMAGGIAHDFNNILGIMLGNLDLLEIGITADEKAMQRISSIRHSGERGATLTRQLLGFSRREAISVKATDINDIIGEMNTLITQSLTPQIEVEYHFEDKLGLTDIDAGDFEDTLINLVLNARDAMQGRGQLTIETQNSVLDEAYCSLNPGVSAGEYIQLVISDTGSGMTPEQQRRIFEPFFTTKEQGKGTGLGLSMVFGFVQRSHGHIKVYSEPGLGTTFRIYLPCSRTTAQTEHSADTPSIPLKNGKESILIVDDEVALLELVEESLSGLGYKVYTATNGVEALQRLDETPAVELLFSDVVMPGGINGYELAEKAIEKNPGLKILLTSGYTEMAVARNGQTRFNTHFLSKPYKLTELAHKIHERLGQD